MCKGRTVRLQPQHLVRQRVTVHDPAALWRRVAGLPQLRSELPASHRGHRGSPLVRMKTSNVGPVLEGSAGASPRPTGRGNSTPSIRTSIVPPAYAPLRTDGPNRSWTLRSSKRAPTRSALETSTDTLGRCPQL